MTSFLPELAVEPVIEFYKGDVLKDRYQILKLSKGGSGQIYYCVDLWDGTPCTLKTHFALMAKGTSKELIQSFRQELYRITQIPPHRYVVPFYRVENIQNIYFLVTEWLPYSLRDWLEQCQSEAGPGLSGQDVLTILLSVCEGMKHCIKWLSTPETPFVHGDLKPENILVSKDGTVKLLDFGGGYTTEYASGEQLSGEPISTRSDIYSMGKILKELLQYCTEGESFLRECKYLAQACCQERPEDRIQSFEQLSQELKRIYCHLAGTEPVLSSSSSGEDIHFQISRLSNLAMIGEAVNVYAELTKMLKAPGADDAALAEGFYHAAEIFCDRGLYSEALPLYNTAIDFDHDTHSMIWSGKAYAYWCLLDWENTYKCATHALSLNQFDYFAIKMSIDAMYNAGHIQELGLVLTALEAIQEKRSEDVQALKYMGYIHYLRHEYDMACQYFGKYVELRKSDWEMLFFYGLSLYIVYDTTKAKQTLRSVIQLLETTSSDHLSRRQLSCLAISNYCLNDQNETVRYLEKFEETYEITPQIAVTEVMLHDNYQLLDRYYPPLSKIAGSITQSASQYPSPGFYAKTIEEIEKLREQWMQETKDASLSSAIRFLNLMSYSYQQVAYIHSGEYAQALSISEQWLKWDRSSPEAWFNKAEMLVQADKYYEAVDCYQKAKEYQTNPERLQDICRRMAEVEFYLQNDAESQRRMIGWLWEQSPSWQGKPAWLQANVEGKEELFDDSFCQSFVMFVKCEVDKAYWISEPYLSTVVQQCFFCAGVMQQVEGTVQEIFIEAAIPVYDFLIKYAGTMGGIFSRVLPLSYSFRGLAYLYRVRGERNENMDRAAADFQSYLSEMARLYPEDQTLLAETYDNLGNTCLLREGGDQRQHLADARKYYQKALDVVSEEENQKEWAMIHYNFGICEFRKHKYKEAMDHFQNCLRYFTVWNRPDMFARANEYVCDIGSLLLPTSSNFMEIFDETFRSCQRLASYYTLSRFPEKHTDILLKMVLLMMKRYDRFQDGSWVLMRQYYQEINEALLSTSVAYELYKSLGERLEKIVSVRF